MKHVVMYSGGVGSWATAKRVAEKHGTADMILLFADTQIEDADLYKFLGESSAKVLRWSAAPPAIDELRQIAKLAGEVSIQPEGESGKLVILADGRTPWEVCEKERIIANSRIDPCSRVLKRELLDKWRNENCTPHNTVIYVGIDWTEKHRLDRLQKRVAPWRYEAPLISPPYRTKRELLAEMQADGIDLPRLYKWGFPHHNCGGFCFKAGHSAFALLLRHLPERYREHEEWEEKMRGIVGDHSIMSDRSGDGVKKPLTMRQFRERTEANPGAPSLFNDDLAAGCGCALE